MDMEGILAITFIFGGRDPVPPVDQPGRARRWPSASGATAARRARIPSCWRRWTPSGPRCRSCTSGWISPSGYCSAAGAREDRGEPVKSTIRRSFIDRHGDGRVDLRSGSLRGPIGEALARRIGRRPALGRRARMAAGRAAARVAELEERLDFTERSAAGAAGRRARQGGTRDAAPGHSADPPTCPSIRTCRHELGRAGDVMIVLLVMAACTIVLWPLVRALARRLEGRGGRTRRSAAKWSGCSSGLAKSTSSRSAIAELEERLDFTERMLAQSREPDRLQR